MLYLKINSEKEGIDRVNMSLKENEDGFLLGDLHAAYISRGIQKVEFEVIHGSDIEGDYVYRIEEGRVYLT